MTPKDIVRSIVEDTLARLAEQGIITSPRDQWPPIIIESPKLAEHGDFATNVAMTLARAERRKPRDIAADIVNNLVDEHQRIATTEIAGPGFINFFLKPAVFFEALGEVDRQREGFGRSDRGEGQRVNVEFVSANPTGPMHVGHGRGAVTGDVIASLLDAAGYQVTREYYVNDAGRQVDVLAGSVFLRYQELLGRSIELPEGCYPGEYVIDVARAILEEEGDRYLDKPEEEVIPHFREVAITAMLDRIRTDLDLFGIHFDVWFSERELVASGAVDRLVKHFEEKGTIYEAEGKKWFRSTDYGDDKDRVVIRESGAGTYFASDIAYHVDKLERGFDRLVNVWGADHGGYIARVKAALAGLGYDPEILQVVLVQMVNLMRNGQPARIGKRSGNLIYLSDVVEEVGRDATRFFFVMRRSDAQLDFDVELAKQKSMDNPVYYVQYGHARISSILRRAEESGYGEPVYDPAALEQLKLPEEMEIIKKVLAYPETVAGAAEAMEPHRIVFYLQELIALFHSYYTRYKHTAKIISEDPETTRARLFLVWALRCVLRNGLGILGVSAPDRMEPPAGEETAEEE